jgi:hypothetical protein
MVSARTDKQQSRDISHREHGCDVMTQAGAEEKGKRLKRHIDKPDI